MDETAGGRAHGAYREPQIKDYGTLAQLTGDGAPLLMRHLGVAGGAALLATTPSTPGDGGGGGGGGVGGIVSVAGTTGNAAGGVIADEGLSPTGGEGTVAGAPADSGAQGAMADNGGRAGQVAGADELPFTGLDVAATAALGAATTAAGVVLRKALDEDTAS